MKKPIWKKKWFWIAIVLVVIISNITSNDKSETTPPVEKPAVSQNKDTDTKIEEPKKTESYDFSKVDVTKDTVTKAVQSVYPGEIKSIDITTEKGVLIVDITTVAKDPFSEKTLVKGFANTSVAIYEKLFTNPKVGKVWVWTATPMLDAKGNSSIEPVVNCALTKENAKDINWSEFKGMVMGDYNALFNIADGKFIHPAIASKLN